MYECNDRLYFIALLNTKPATAMFQAKNQTMHFLAGDAANLPVYYKPNKSISSLAYQNIDIAKNDWDSSETSWGFLGNYLLDEIEWNSKENDFRKKISRCYKKLKEKTELMFENLKANEEELNRIFIDIYGLSEELTPEVADKDVTVARIYDTKEEIPESMRENAYVLTKADVIKSLLSYAVGCMFGRYSLDVEGLAYAGGDWDASKYTTFIPDADNVIPIFDEVYSDDDIVQLFTAWLKKVYGDETLEENLAFIADALGKKPSESSRECIRQYFLKNFYKDHIKTYKKRPIYWLYDSGKKNGFKALIYMHRYDVDTTGLVRVDYLHRIERTYESEIERMTSDINHGDDARDIAKATKRRDKLQKQLKECQEYDEQISQPALARIDIDLDDGVKVNYEKVQTVNGKTYKMLAKI